METEDTQSPMLKYGVYEKSLKLEIDKPLIQTHLSH